LLASDDGSGDLAAGQNRGGSNFDFGSAVGIVRDRIRYRCVESDTDEICFCIAFSDRDGSFILPLSSLGSSFGCN